MAARLIAFVLVLLAPSLVSAQALMSEFTEGRHYFRIDPPQPTQVEAGKVEVVEVFSYACVHCANFEPFVTAWNRDKPEHVEFRAVPAVFSPAWEPYARAYYASKELGVLETTHQPLFAALHRDRKPLQTIQDIAGFVAGLGVDQEAFLAAATSEATEQKLREGQAQIQSYRVEGTPTMIVAGKYLVPPAGGQATLRVVDHLVAREAAASN